MTETHATLELYRYAAVVLAGHVGQLIERRANRTIGGQAYKRLTREAAIGQEAQALLARLAANLPEST
jgi:hypothetical protein